jgi:hypothetical protein
MKSRTIITILAILAFVFLASAQQPKGMKPGVERWPIKTSAHKMLDVPEDVDFDKLIVLPDPPGVKKNDPRYQDAFIPSFQNSQNLDEGDMIRVSGWLHLVAYETDGDYHVQISNSDTSGDHCLIIEVPYPTYVKHAPNLKAKCTAVRNFLKSHLPGKKYPSTGGTVLPKPIYVTVVGQLFYDDSHVGDPPRGKIGLAHV